MQLHSVPLLYRLVSTCRHLFCPCFHCDRIVCSLSQLRRSMMLEVLPCILLHQAVDLQHLQGSLGHLSQEVHLIDRNRLHRLLHLHAQRHNRLPDAHWLQDCEQLLYRMQTELTALCTADPSCLPSPRVRERLHGYGVLFPHIPHAHVHSRNMDYHVLRLLNTCAYLDDLLAISENTDQFSHFMARL